MTAAAKTLTLRRKEERRRRRAEKKRRQAQAQMEDTVNDAGMSRSATRKRGEVANPLALALADSDDSDAQD